MDYATPHPAAPDGAVASALVRVLLESRRELLNAIAMTQALIRENATLRWHDDDSFVLNDLELKGTNWMDEVGFMPTPLLASAVTPVLAYSRRHPSSRNGLRLVLPDRHESPLVLPTDTHHANFGEPKDEHRHDRGRLDDDEGKDSRDVGKADR